MACLSEDVACLSETVDGGEEPVEAAALSILRFEGTVEDPVGSPANGELVETGSFL